MNINITTLKIEYEEETVLARQCARQIAAMLGFDPREQTAIATSVSEIVRNAINYAGGGVVDFLITDDSFPQIFYIHIKDKGPGIKNLAQILEGKYKSSTGLGIGISGSRKLMDIFKINNSDGDGTTVILGKKLGLDKKMITQNEINHITTELIRLKRNDPVEEVKQQNRELMATLADVRKKQADLEKLNEELEETNRGIVALFAELDERAEHFKTLNEAKIKFLSNMSHEFKTPLNSITALTKMLLKRSDGDINEEQEKQIKFIQQSSSELTEIVNDILDLAKVDAGKITIKPKAFLVEDLFATLRGMLRPLVSGPSVELIFNTPKDRIELFSDQGKVSQILRNFISNALKFTEKGKIIADAKLHKESGQVLFSVSDTGIGIVKEDQDLIFDEFGQSDNRLQSKLSGTGLGLPLARKLTELLGGSLCFQSQPGIGSTFYAAIPVQFSPQAASGKKLPESHSNLMELPILVIEDDDEMLLAYENFLSGSEFRILAAKSIAEGRAWILKVRPKIIILDILLEEEDAWDYLIELKSNEKTKDIPVIVVSVLNEAKRGISLGADDYFVKPVDPRHLLNKIRTLQDQKKIERILIIDDEEVSRYILKEMLGNDKYDIIEAESGPSGIEMAVNHKPDLIFLDIVMPEMNGFEVLESIKKHESTRNIPVIIHTSKDLNIDEINMLNNSTSYLLIKNNYSQKDLLNKIRSALVNKDHKNKDNS